MERHFGRIASVVTFIYSSVNGTCYRETIFMNCSIFLLKTNLSIFSRFTVYFSWHLVKFLSLFLSNLSLLTSSRKYVLLDNYNAFLKVSVISMIFCSCVYSFMSKLSCSCLHCSSKNLSTCEILAWKVVRHSISRFNSDLFSLISRSFALIEDKAIFSWFYILW